ncbi:MAG: hypothetical protein ND807_14015 [Vicinamibacterales bacterium]|nr:hypothetical protein [Vicinamibacterales bacterium]
MRKFIAAGILVVACSVGAFAAAATHSTTGTVKSIDATTLVITHGGKDMTFTLNGTTQKAGSVATGSQVTVRYQSEGKSMVATAVTEQPMKQVASKSKK